MKFIISLFLLFTLCGARFARYTPLLCDNKDTYKLCNASMHGDYMVGNRSIHITMDPHLFIENDVQFCAYRSGKLFVPFTPLNLERWESILNNYINW